MRHSFIFFSSALFVSQALAKVEIHESCSADKAKIENAVKDAQTIAAAALTGLQTGKCGGSDVAYNGAFDPLFSPEDKESLTSTFQRLGDMTTADNYLITIYCSTDHVKKETHADVAMGEQWYDTAFVNKGTEGNGENIPAILDQDSKDKAAGKKPGDTESFAVLGWTPDAPKRDFGDQAHIFIHSDAINPDSNQFDTRPLGDIVQNGFLPGKSLLDNIRGTSTTVLHELIHVAGGLISQNSRGARIGDGPGGIVYTWVFCMVAQANQAEVGFRTRDCADCLTMFAQACYLQIKKEGNPPTCWNTGKVFPDTLEAIPGDQPVPQKRDVARVIEARARWYADHK